jgi:hypothetical protein
MQGFLSGGGRYFILYEGQSQPVPEICRAIYRVSSQIRWELSLTHRISHEGSSPVPPDPGGWGEEGNPGSFARQPGDGTYVYWGGGGGGIPRSLTGESF